MEISVREVSQPLPIDAQNGDSFYADERWLNLIQTVYGFNVTRLEVRGEVTALYVASCRYARSVARSLGGVSCRCRFRTLWHGRRPTAQPRISWSTRRSNWGADTARAILSFALARRRFSRSVKISSPPITTSLATVSGSR